jgi:hypothetical protein
MVGVVPCTDIHAAKTVSEFPRPLNPQIQRTKASRGYQVDLYGSNKAPTSHNSSWNKFMEYVLGL